MDGAVIDSLDDDHDAFIRIFQTADPCEAKTEAIRRRYEAIAEIQSASREREAGAVSTGLNASTAQMASRMMNEQSQQPSLMDVTA